MNSWSLSSLSDKFCRVERRKPSNGKQPLKTFGASCSKHFDEVAQLQFDEENRRGCVAMMYFWSSPVNETSQLLVNRFNSWLTPKEPIVKESFRRKSAGRSAMNPERNECVWLLNERCVRISMLINSRAPKRIWAFSTVRWACSQREARTR